MTKKDLFATLIKLGKRSNGQNPFELAQAVIGLSKHAKALQRIAENECNGWPKEIEERRDNRLYRYNVENEEWRDKDLKKKERICKQLRTYPDTFRFETQGDPRGAVLKAKVFGTDITEVLYK